MQPTLFSAQLASTRASEKLRPRPDHRPRRARRRPRLLGRGDPGYDAATRVFNQEVVQTPVAVSVPRTAGEVADVVRHARDRGLQVAPQRTGHNAGPLGRLDDAILLRTDALRDVTIDAETRVVRVGAGARWADVVPRASELGLAALHGSTPTVSVAGYALGGGVGWYGRRHGLACNSITAIELVTPDGVERRVDADHEPELFWALRGGGGNFGVVTALELALLPVTTVHAGLMCFPWERAAEVLHAWREWTTTVPDEVTSVARLLQFPPIPDIPEPFRGQRLAAVDAVVLGDEALGAELLAPLRALGPVMDTFATVPPAAVAHLHGDPPGPVRSVVGSQMLGGLDAVTIDRFVEAAGPGSGSGLLVADIRHVGGALRRAQPGAGALATLDAEYLTMAVGMVRDDASRRAHEERIAAVAASLAPHDTGRLYANFVEHRADPARFYGEDALRRLRAVRAAVDPHGLMRANHVIG